MLWFDLRRAEISFWFPFHKHQVGLLQCYKHQGRPNHLIWFDTWWEMISFIKKKQNCPHQVIGCLIHQGRPIPFDSMSAGVPDICCTSRHKSGTSSHRCNMIIMIWIPFVGKLVTSPPLGIFLPLCHLWISCEYFETFCAPEIFSLPFGILQLGLEEGNILVGSETS